MEHVMAQVRLRAASTYFSLEGFVLVLGLVCFIFIFVF